MISWGMDEIVEVKTTLSQSVAERLRAVAYLHERTIEESLQQAVYEYIEQYDRHINNLLTLKAKLKDDVYRGKAGPEYASDTLNLFRTGVKNSLSKGAVVSHE